CVRRHGIRWTTPFEPPLTPTIFINEMESASVRTMRVYSDPRISISSKDPPPRVRSIGTAISVSAPRLILLTCATRQQDVIDPRTPRTSARYLAVSQLPFDVVPKDVSSGNRGYSST